MNRATLAEQTCFVATPFVLAGSTTSGIWSNALAGLILIGLSLVRGRVKENYGSWNRYIV